MAEFYRFRSIDALLGKHRELEEQTIYFASPEELNDPMEGLRDIVWDGDEIVWTNFFKHYVFCLNRCYFLLNVTQHPRKLEPTDIPILERWDQITIPIEQVLFDDIWDRFCNLPYIHEFIEVLANTGRKIRYREIVCYIHMIQACGLLDETRKSYIDRGLMPESPSLQLSENVGMVMLCDTIQQAEGYENTQALDIAFQIAEDRINDIKLTFSPAVLEGINRSLMLDFPRIYVEQLDRLLWENWYTACFTESYHNSSVWAKYTDGHKGACLIFKAVEEDGSKNLKLNWRKGSRTLPFHEVNYADRPGEIDFFRTIARMRGTHFRELWYTDQNGRASECASHIGSDRSEAIWREDYRNNFLRDVTFKTRDWKYEQEYRLILEDILSQHNEKVDRKLSYDFNSLKGIIFGMRTSTEDKVKIIEIIEEKKKCPENNQADFKFFEAYYSSKDGGIRVREIQLG